MADDTNVITLVARLTRDPELRSLQSGTAVCSLRVAYNVSKKDTGTGEWTDAGHFVDVTVWGNQGEAIARNLTKGQRICITGRLEYREWEDKDGNNRSAHAIVAQRVQYLDPKADRAPAPANQTTTRKAAPGAGVPADEVPF